MGTEPQRRDLMACSPVGVRARSDASGSAMTAPPGLLGRLSLVLVVVVVVGVVSAVPAFAHGGATNSSASELVLEAIAILEVHPAPSAAVADKIHDALDAKDQQGVQADLVRSANTALNQGDIAATKRLLGQAVGACPDADILYVADQRARPPCIAPAHAFALARRSIGGTSEIVILIVAGVLALAGVAIIRHPAVRTPAEGRTP